MSNKEHHREHKHPRECPPDQEPRDTTGGETAPTQEIAAAAPAPAPAPAREPPQVQPELAELQAQRDDLLARLQRVSADYLNLQKRTQREIATARQYAGEDLIRSLLGVLDDLDRAIQHGQAGCPADDPMLAGMKLVRDNAMNALGRHGLCAIHAAEGEPFDPSRHAALMQQASDKYSPNTVLQELQKGYRLNDRTLRPAQVVVSRQPEAVPE